MSPRWSAEAIDYAAGVDVVDAQDGRVLTAEELANTPLNERKRLLLRPRKVGCLVATVEEVDEQLKERGWKGTAGEKNP
jgi:hypothetical protein